MTLQTRYTLLCNEFLSVAQTYIDTNILKVLKEKYEHCIDSNRKLSYVKDLRGLLKLLEKRDILSYNSIEPLSYISKEFLRSSHLETKLMDYEVYFQSMQHSPLCNMYQVEQEHDSNETEKLSTASNSCTSESKVSTSHNIERQHGYNIQSGCSPLDKETMLQQMVLLQVSERLGRSWRDVARHLGILEYKIDAIQNKYPFNLKEQSYEALKDYISHCTSENWKLDLMRALEKGRRKDLKEIVEELAMHTSFK